MINCIIIDDEESGLELVKSYVEKTESHELLGTFLNPLEGLEYIKSNDIKVVYLDIEMPDISGLEFVELLDRYYSVEKGPKVIFSTGHRSYALDSFQYDRVIGFLKKPFSCKQFAIFAGKLERVLGYNRENKVNDEDAVVFSRYNKKVVLPVDEILYISSEGNSVFFMLKNGNIERFYMALYEVEEKLPAEKFIRTHRSYIVAKHSIQSIERLHLKLYDYQIKFPVGKKYRDDVLKLKGQ